MNETFEHTQRDSDQSVPHVSVVMVSFNTRELTLDAIRSVFASVTDANFHVEVIVVDNASADCSPEAIEECFPQVRLIRSPENLGFGRGNNLGVTLARGRAIMLLNTDTVVRPGAIETLYKTLFADSKRGVVGPYLQNADGSYQNSMVSFPSVWRTFCNHFWLDHLFPSVPLFADEFMIHADHDCEQDVDVVNGAAMMVRADLYRRVKGFDPDYFMYYEEVDLCKRTAEEGFTTRYVPSAKVLHLIRQSHKVKPVGWYYSIARTSRMIYARKHMGPLARLAVATIMHVGHGLRILLYHTVGYASPRLREVGHNMWMSYANTELRGFDTKKSTR